MASLLGVVTLITAGAAGAAQTGTPLPAVITQLVAETAAAPPTQLTFTITPTVSPAPDLQVTLTDLGANTALALTSASVVVMQAGSVVSSAPLTAASPAVTLIAAASGTYTMYIFGVPGSNGVGTFSACTAPKANNTSCIASASIPAGNITLPTPVSGSTNSNLVINIAITAQDTYTFTFTDLQYPAALSVLPTATLTQGATQIATNFPSSTTLSLSQGVYQLILSAQSDPNVQAGLYSVKVAGALGGVPLPSTAVPIGLTTASQQFTNPTAQSLTLTVTDFGFPGVLTNASAFVTAGGSVGGVVGGAPVGTASTAGGAVTLTAPAGTLNVFTYGTAGTTAGTFGVEVAAGTNNLFTTAEGVSLPASNLFAYAFVAPITSAGAYQATTTDLQFPAQLGGMSFAVAQNGAILQQFATAGSLNFNAAVGSVVLLVGAQPAGGGVNAIDSGFFDVNVQSSTAANIFDQTQSISVTTTGTTTAAIFYSQPVTVVSGASLTATLADLMVPAALSNVGMMISRGSQVSGKIIGSDTLSFLGSAGTYQVTFFAIPATTQQFGLYTASLNLSSSPPAITLTSSAANAVTGSSITLSWTVGNSTSCTASGGAWAGSNLIPATSASVVLSATTTYTMTCTGPGGTATTSVTVTATAPTTSTTTTTTTSSSSGGGHSGGGSIDVIWLLMGASVLTAKRFRQRDSSRLR